LHDPGTLQFAADLGFNLPLATLVAGKWVCFTENKQFTGKNSPL